MLKTILELKEPLTYISNNTTNKEFKRIFFNPKEWLIISYLKQIFKVFVKPSIKLQGQLYITLSTALLYIYQIFNKLEGLIETFNKEIEKNPLLVS